jgi:phosphoglucomutase
MSTRLSALAGKPAPASLLLDVPRLITAYYSECPDPTVLAQQVAFGTVWTTDKDGIVPALLLAQITARAGHDPGEIYRKLASELGDPVYERIDAPATPEQKAILAAVTAQQVRCADLAGDSIQAIITHAPGNDAAIGGVKVVTANGWFAARPSGTEDIYKIYPESYRGPEHLQRIEEDAQTIRGAAFDRARTAGGAAVANVDGASETTS